MYKLLFHYLLYKNIVYIVNYFKFHNILHEIKLINAYIFNNEYIFLNRKLLFKNKNNI